MLLAVASACGSAASTPAPAAAPTAMTDSTPTAVSTEVKPTDASTSTSDNSGASAKIDSYKLMQDNGSGAAGDEVKSFKASNHTQYFAVQLTQFLKVGSAVKWVFTAVDTTAGKDIKITEANVNVIVGNQLTANLSLQKDFPVGKYKADISVDGMPLGSIDYTVTE